MSRWNFLSLPHLLAFVHLKGCAILWGPVPLSVREAFNLACITDYQPKRGRPRALPQMGEFDLSLISEFRNRPSFYDRSSPRFKDKLYNAHEWQEISNKLGFDVSILKDRILQLRNRYNLEKRRIEQLREENPYKTYESPWPLYDHLHFLSDHIRARRSYKKMMPLNGSAQYAAGPELSNSCSNNSNLTLRHASASSAGGLEIGGDGQNISNAYPNGLLTVKMEDGSEQTDADADETESQHNESEINAFETSGLIMETHSSTVQQQHTPYRQQQQHHPSISIRRLETLRSDFEDTPTTTYHKKQSHKRQLHQHQHQTHKFQQRNRHLHYSSNQQNEDNDYVITNAAAAGPALGGIALAEEAAGGGPTPPKQTAFNARQYKYTAFGNFIASSLLDLPPSIALELVEKFTSDVVKVLMENAEHDVDNLQ